MARLNTNDPPPRRSLRSETVDSLYRDPTPLSRVQPASSARNSSYSVLSPGLSQTSDKENQLPESPDTTPRPVDKGKRPMAQRLPTPHSTSSSANSNKRRRTGDHNFVRASSTYSAVPTTDMDQDDDDDDNGEQEPDEDADDFTKYYDPMQDKDIQRQVRANIRNYMRQAEEKRDELIRANDGIATLVKQNNKNYRKVKQTADATLDAAFLNTMTDLAGRQANNSDLGGGPVGVDLDNFVSKCITFMEHGGAVVDADGPTQVRRRRRDALVNAEDDEEEEEDDDVGEGLDWAVLGAKACFPVNRRPPVSSFLLGPLSVQKRVRATQRRARSQRQPLGPATRPQELNAEDIRQSEASSLTAIVSGLKVKLEAHIIAGKEKVDADLSEMDDYTDEELIRVCRKHRMSLIQDGEDLEGAVSLFDFAINPRSFGQTVENLFYVSFLIREGNCKVLFDEDGLPVLVPSSPRTVDENRAQNVQKHQSIFSIDWATWEKLIKAFDIKTPLIPHRTREEAPVAAGGWYAS